MSHRRSRSGSPLSYSTNSNDPRDLERRIFVGNLPTTHMANKDMEELFRPYGKIQALSLYRGYGFVQFERVEDAEAAKAGHNGRIYRGYKLDINMAAERQRPQKARPSPPRRPQNHGDGREPRPRSRSPVHGRDSRERRDGRDKRESSRELRPGPPRNHEDERYRAVDGREKDQRETPFRNDYDRFYRGEYDANRIKEEPYMDRYRETWSGRKDSEERLRSEERMRPEERRRNELYRQYYEELQKRYEAERPVDCSVIVVNKQQKEYAETVGRKIRDLGMLVDLIFLNTEVSLTQAIEDVSRARTAFAIIITQQHEVHHSCTVNILIGTPQEHRNMPMEDALVLVAHNYNTFKVEMRTKERDEIARKAAKMADDVLLRELDRQAPPVSVLTAITLLSEGRFLNHQELTALINYLQDKRDRLVRSTADPHFVSLSHDLVQPAKASPTASHQTLPSTHSLNTSHLPPASASATSQQELQAKILSLFNSSSSSAVTPSSASTPLTQGYGSTENAGLSSFSKMATSAVESQGGMATRAGVPAQANRGAAPQGLRRAGGSSGANINFDNPSVQKALDTLIQSGPAINKLVNSSGGISRSNPGSGQAMSQGLGQGQGVRQGLNQGMGQGINKGVGQGFGQGMGQRMGQGLGQGSHYPHHY